MDDIRMYNRTLSDEEVSELFNECYYGLLFLIIFKVARYAIHGLVIFVLHVKRHLLGRIFNVIKGKNYFYLIAVQLGFIQIIKTVLHALSNAQHAHLIHLAKIVQLAITDLIINVK